VSYKLFVVHHEMLFLHQMLYQNLINFRVIKLILIYQKVCTSIKNL